MGDIFTPSLFFSKKTVLTSDGTWTFSFTICAATAAVFWLVKGACSSYTVVGGRERDVTEETREKERGKLTDVQNMNCKTHLIASSLLTLLILAETSSAGTHMFLNFTLSLLIWLKYTLLHNLLSTGTVTNWNIINESYLLGNNIYVLF